MASDGASAVGKALVHRAVKVRRNENVIVETWSHTLPYAAACVVEARRVGAHVMLLLEEESAYWESVGVAPRSSLGRVGDHEWAALAKADAYVFFPGPENYPRLEALPAETRAGLLAYNSEWYQRAHRARIRGVRSALGYASDSRASYWGVDGEWWRNSLVAASTQVDYDALGRDARKLAARLARGREAHITGPSGTDLKVRLRQRRPYEDDGSVDRRDMEQGRNIANSPPGGVGVAIGEGSAEGTVIASRPTFAGFGRLDGGQWEVHDGKIVSASFTDGQSAFESAYSAAPKGKEVVSILSIGLNPALAPGTPVVEDQEAGAVTIGAGGNTAYGGTNRCPFVSYLIVGEASVALDGKPLCDRGKLLL